MRFIQNIGGCDPEMNEQPPYLDQCRKMDADELAVYIRENLHQMYDYDPGIGHPHTYEEFLVVWRLLRTKTDAGTPALPTRNPLEAAYAKRRRTQDLLYNEAPGNPKFTKRDRRKMELTLERLDREIEEMKAPAPETPKQAALNIASEIFEEIEHVFKRTPTDRRLQWHPARPGSLSIANISRYYEDKRHYNPETRFDMDRIEKAKTLDPDDPPWLGPDGFDGYIIFTFPGTTKALMECPEVGNAAYVIHKGWESWSQMDKQELIAEAERGGDVTRIPHQGDDWPDKIKRELERE
jgi:hypothetical protein